MLLFPARRVGQVSLQRESIWIETITKNCWFWCLLNSWCRIFFCKGWELICQWQKPVDPRTALLIPGKLWWPVIWSFSMFQARVWFLSANKNFLALQPDFALRQVPPWVRILCFNDTQVFGGPSHFLPPVQTRYILLSLPLLFLRLSWHPHHRTWAFPPVVLPQDLGCWELYSLLGCKGTPGLDWCWYTLMLWLAD